MKLASGLMYKSMCALCFCFQVVAGAAAPGEVYKPVEVRCAADVTAGVALFCPSLIPS